MWSGSSTETSEASVTGSDRVQAETERIPAILERTGYWKVS